MSEEPAKPKKRKVRKSIFSLVIAEKIFEMISRGNYVETAAAHAGIGKNTYFEWIRRGKRELLRLKENPRAKTNPTESDFVYFYQKVEHCLAEAETKALGRIMKAAEGGFVSVEIKEVKDKAGNVTETIVTRKTLGPQWQAEAWRLERMFPHKFGRRVEVTQGDGKDRTGNLTPEEFMGKCQEAAEKMLTFTPLGTEPHKKESA